MLIVGFVGLGGVIWERVQRKPMQAMSENQPE
jgi:hypothetical protein